MLPAGEMPLERVERDIDWIKRLPSIVIPTESGSGHLRLGAWESLPEYIKEIVLDSLDWRGVDSADRRRIVEREIDWDALRADPYYPEVLVPVLRRPGSLRTTL